MNVQGRVAEVELLLDGEEVATFDSPPWVAPIDLGPALSPHELVARALDEKGSEITRVRQWINMPRPPAEAKILLERDAKGRVKAATIAWQNLMGEEPSKISVSFDGRPVAIDAFRRVIIPPYAPEVSHVLTVELDFESGMSSRDDLAIGGGAGDEARSELTAVPVRRTTRRKLEPKAFDGLLRVRDQPLRVATVEEGGASLWIVRDESALESFSKLRSGSGSPLGGIFAPSALPLKKGDEVRFLWPRPRGVAGAAVPTALFPSSQLFDRSSGGLAFLLERITNTEPAGLFPMYTDAVAVAGLNAFESFGRRAVLLVLDRLGPGPEHLQARGRPAVPGDPARAALRLVARRGALPANPRGAASTPSARAGGCAPPTRGCASRSTHRRSFGSRAAISPRRSSSRHPHRASNSCADNV